MHVAQSAVQSKIGPNLPGIANVKLKTGIELPAGGQTEFGFFRKKALTVAENDAIYRIVQGIASTSSEGATRSRRLIFRTKIRAYRWI